MLKCTLGQPLTRCKYTAKLLDFLMMNRDQEMHLSGCREICIKMKIMYTCICKILMNRIECTQVKPTTLAFR